MSDAPIFAVKFVPNPVQRAFIESRAKADLFSSRMGEGKSAALAWAPFYHTCNNPGAYWAIIRDTWENLRDTTLKEFFKWFPPGVMGSWNESKKTFTWAEGVAKGSVVFLGMDDPGDSSKLMSRELAGFCIDEPAPAATSGGVAEMIFDMGLSRLRQTGMKWYGAKLAENNPDETHWTYRRFVDPGSDEFKIWQPITPENEKNLPSGYYQGLRQLWGHRPDLQRRFIDGKFGFQQEGRVVTPEWSDDLHLAIGLVPVPRTDLVLLWDFGLNPTCIITQITPMRNWLILNSFVGEEMGVEELINAAVKPCLVENYRNFRWAHIGDPAGRQREQSSIRRSAVRLLTSSLGGTFRAGPVKIEERREPLRAALARSVAGRGMIQVDREHAKHVWYALRGGWHYHVSRAGIVSQEPVKDQHSHPGDAMGYGAAVLFPMGRLQGAKTGLLRPKTATFFGQGQKPKPKVPLEARVIGA